MRNDQASEDVLDAYEQLAERAARTPADQGDIAPLAALVAADLKRRGRWFGRTTDPNAAAPHSDPITPERVRGGWLVPVFIGAWLVLLLAVAMIVGWLMALPFAAVLVPVLFLEIHRRRSDRARHEQAARPMCPKCSYDLSGLGDDLPRAWVVGSSGPRRCPECGAPWPLVVREGWE